MVRRRLISRCWHFQKQWLQLGHHHDAFIEAAHIVGRVQAGLEHKVGELPILGVLVGDGRQRSTVVESLPVILY